LNGSSASPALLAGLLAFQVVSLAAVVWWHLRRGLPSRPRHFAREVALITTVTFLAFVGGAIAVIGVTSTLVSGAVLTVIALLGGSAAGYIALTPMLKRIFHLTPGQAFGLAARIGLTTMFVWVLASFAGQAALRALAGR